MRPYQQSDLPDWLSALLLQRYPQNPAGLSLLTLALRPAATTHLMVQPITPEALLTGYELLRVQAEYPLPAPLYADRQQQGPPPSAPPWLRTVKRSEPSLCTHSQGVT